MWGGGQGQGCRGLAGGPESPALLGLAALPPSWSGSTAAPRTLRLRVFLPLTATSSALGSNPSSAIPKLLIVSAPRFPRL